MQLSGLHRRHPAPAFINHTPKEFEITPLSPSQSPEMFGHTGLAVGAGPLYTNAIMGQAPSAVERENLRKASSTILREDSIHIEEESGEASRPDSWSMHYDCTNQAPIKAASHDLAFFLRTTGPTASHRRPSKNEHPRRALAENALRFLKKAQKRPTTPVITAHDKLNGVLRDEGGLLEEIVEEPPLPGASQRQTSSGQRYLALQVHHPTLEDMICEDAPDSSHDVLESRVSISFSDDVHSSPVLDNWLLTFSKEHSRRNTPTPPRKSSAHLPLGDVNTVRVVDYSSSPIRPAASNPPTPLPESAVSMAESYRSDLYDHPAKRSFEACRALSSHPVHPSPSVSALPKISLPHEEFPVKHPSPEKEVDIKHPSPRRFASHPVLLQRASSIASSLYPRSFSDSPGPPPPRSPLRLRRDPRTIESIIASHNSTRKATPKTAPTIRPIAEYNEEIATIRPTVITDCTGPIKRPKSREKKLVGHPAYPASRKEREDRIRQRKLRDRPYAARTIDAVVHAAPPAPRQRLRKARPQIQIPELRPAPLVTRASSSASSDASWKRITESTRTPVSPVPSQDSPGSNGEKTGYTPISPATSNGSASADARLSLSPVTLVAEEIPVPKTKSPCRPAKLILKEGKTYAPRPRSASIPRNVMKRRSRTAPQTPNMQTPPRSISPAGQRPKGDTPPLPSPPPNRALPPTPPASGSEKPPKVRCGENKKELPILPAFEISPKNATPPKRREPLPHVATQAQRKSTGSKDSARSSKIDARLEALEKQNALLSAALMAVLRTNGALNNGPLAVLAEAETPRPMAWENRVARRSAASQAASHTASSSNGSALEMYMATRRGSKHGCQTGP
ncbi:hypothetical protein LTR36_010152 [Oleoguttula mirabilis]|uniref:Uncharacterized protein n=1 Tax=Oleoguttula mirabilis TaxID=1507867 RepID=A0AAV9JT97_9PEZI|nr:hypothetical protein LTR36_010152 [Oleoguttula mirabilis]